MINNAPAWPFGVEQKPYEKFLAIPFDLTLAGNASTFQTLQLSNGYDFILSIINAYSSQAEGFSFNIKDGFTFESLFKDKVRSSIITGNGQNPFLLPKQHRFKNGKTIEIEITNLSASSNTIQLALAGHRDDSLGKYVQVTSDGAIKQASECMKLPAGSALYRLERLFILPFNFTMTSGASLSDKYPISSEFDFIWEILNVYHGATSPREFTLQIRDELTSENLFVSPVRASLVSGNGQNPFILPRPYIFNGGTTINISVADTGTGADFSIQLAMVGYKAKKIK